MPLQWTYVNWSAWLWPDLRPHVRETLVFVAEGGKGEEGRKLCVGGYYLEAWAALLDWPQVSCLHLLRRTGPHGP